MKIIYKVPGKRSEGDRKTLASGREFVRRQVRVYDGSGKCIGREVTRHGPCFEWVEILYSELDLAM